MVYDRIPGVDENFRLPPDVMKTIIPPGSLLQYGGDTAPPGFAIADGAEVSRVGTYAGVFEAYGTKFGEGDGSTTFNLPDLRGRVIVGYDVSQIEFNQIGKEGGSKEVTLSVAELPAHTHSQVRNLNGAPSTMGSGGTPAFPVTGDTTTNTGSAGNGEAHENMPPFVVMNYLVKL